MTCRGRVPAPCIPHQHQQSGDEEGDEVPQQSGEPESGLVDATDELDVLGLAGSLFDYQDGKRARQESKTKQQVDNEIMSFTGPVKYSTRGEKYQFKQNCSQQPPSKMTVCN